MTPLIPSFFCKKGYDEMKVFVIAGKSGSGKGEVAKFINEYYIYKLQKNVVTSYSKYLKLFAKEMTDWDGISEQKPRDFLQSFGTKIRNYDNKFFTKRMIEDIELYQLEGIDNIIIGDARMPDEIDEIRNNYDDVYAIYVENQFGQSKLTIEQQAHITETALEGYNDFDYVLSNDNNLENLKDKVFKFLEGIEK